MKMIWKVAVRVLLNALAIYLAARLISGFSASSEPKDLLWLGFWLGVVNTFVRPILKLISLPLIILSLGLFTILINAAMLLLVDHFSAALTIAGFWPALQAVVVIGLFNLLLSKTFLKN